LSKANFNFSETLKELTGYEYSQIRFEQIHVQNALLMLAIKELKEIKELLKKEDK
jgi:hypothetical protein